MKSTDNGITFSKPQDISKIPESNPQVYTNYLAMSASRNNVYVAWQEYDESRDGNNVQESVRFTKSNDGGDNFDSASTFSQNGTTPVPQFVSRGNEVYITWYDGNGISFKRSVDSGNSFDDTLILTKDFVYPKISLPSGGSSTTTYT